TYDAFGQQVAHTGTAATPLTYGGGYSDAESGLLYLIHREYDPATGQFLTVDPLVADTGTPYTYADNDPINATDPPGMFSITGCFLFCGGYDSGHGIGVGLGSPSLDVEINVGKATASGGLDDKKALSWSAMVYPGSGYTSVSLKVGGWGEVATWSHGYE